MHALSGQSARTGALSPRPAPDLRKEGASRPPGRPLSSDGLAEAVGLTLGRVGRGNAVRFLIRPSLGVFPWLRP